MLWIYIERLIAMGKLANDPLNSPIHVIRSFADYICSIDHPLTSLTVFSKNRVLQLIHSFYFCIINVRNMEKHINYTRVSEAIAYISTHFRQQPTLDEVAAEVGLSPFHFQRLFTDWAGVSPKQFLQYISVEHAKQILKESTNTLFDAAHETGLSGT